MRKEGVYICDFELVDKGERVFVKPHGLDGATEGMDFDDAVAMAADWLKETALDYLARGEEWPELPLGTDPLQGGRMVTVAVPASLDDIPAVNAAEAARMLGVSTARVTQLCNAGLLESWKSGRTRMVSVESIEARIEDGVQLGRPKKERATV